MNWKPTTDTADLTRAMDNCSDQLLFNMCSDALIESGSSISLWDWLMVGFDVQHIYNKMDKTGGGLPDGAEGTGEWSPHNIWGYGEHDYNYNLFSTFSEIRTNGEGNGHCKCYSFYWDSHGEGAYNPDVPNPHENHGI